METFETLLMKQAGKLPKTTRKTGQPKESKRFLQRIVDGEPRITQANDVVMRRLGVQFGRYPKESTPELIAKHDAMRDPSYPMEFHPIKNAMDIVDDDRYGIKRFDEIIAVCQELTIPGTYVSAAYLKRINRGMNTGTLDAIRQEIAQDAVNRYVYNERLGK